MKRVGILVIAVAAAVTMACGGSDNGSASPTGPSGGSGGGASQPAPTPSSGGLSAPTNLTVKVVGTQVTLNWSSSGSPQYQILVGTSPSSANALITNTTQTTYTWTVSPGSYYARVQSMSGSTTSGSSNEVNFTVSG
ncbi:MAG TPA: hypothetical protein VH436_26680 [Vicinamibacterales bacterium]|jgi:hypothetical protein